MLEIRNAVVPFEANELMELERIVTDNDERGALHFLKKCVYDRISHSQHGKLKSHVDTSKPVELFVQHTD
jgi:hypothetical protein